MVLSLFLIFGCEYLYLHILYGLRLRTFMDYATLRNGRVRVNVGVGIKRAELRAWNNNTSGYRRESISVTQCRSLTF